MVPILKNRSGSKTGQLGGLCTARQSQQNRKNKNPNTFQSHDYLSAENPRHNKAHDKKINVSYFRTRAGYEVDLIIEIDGKRYAAEIKSGQATAPDANKLEHFKTYDKNCHNFFIVSTDPLPRKMGDVKVRSLPQFLREIGL